MLGNELRQALHAGQRVYGVAVEGYGQPRWPRFFSDLGLDFIFLDNEHTPLNRETAAWAMEAYAAHGIAPLLRIPELSASLAAAGMDAGAHGIIAPYVETAAQVRALVGAVKRRPLKGEALRRWAEEGSLPTGDTPDYLQRFNENSVLVIMIESRDGIDNLPDLLAVGGVDAVLIGPHDLSISLGIPEQYDDDRFTAALREIVGRCSEHGIAAGVHYNAGSLERAVDWLKLGFSFICHRTDTLYIARGIYEELGHLRRALGDMSGDSVAPSDLLGAGGHASVTSQQNG